MKSPKRPLSIRRYASLIMAVGIIALIADLIVSVMLIVMMQRETENRMNEALSSYATSIDQSFYAVQFYMNWSIYRDENIRMIDSLRTVDKAMPYMEILHNQFSIMQQSYLLPFQFFLYFADQDTFTNRGTMTMTYSAFTDLKGQLIHYVKETAETSTRYPNWMPFFHGDEAFLVSISPYRNRYLICIVAVDDLMRPLWDMGVNNQSVAALSDRTGTILDGLRELDAHGVRIEDGALKPSGVMIDMHTDFLDGRYTMHLVSNRYGAFETALFVQFFVALLMLFMGGFLFFSMFYIRLSIMAPIQRFSENLKLFRDGENGTPIDLNSSRIAELEQVNEHIRNLAEQVRDLKIDIYENERERQKIQLEYLQLQIKPHFFLNCLTSIDGMAQLHMDEEIRQMAQTTSAYFRYIFMSGQDYVPLHSELEHIRNYLDIHKLRYGSALRYEIACEGDAERASIPPLTLQPFIENAVRHAVSLDDEVWIRVDIRLFHEGGCPSVVIRIVDTGVGFSPDVLENLRNEGALFSAENGHIGIRNTLQRLRVHFDARVRLVFDNDDRQGGASITITIPFIPMTVEGGIA